MINLEDVKKLVDDFKKEKDGLGKVINPIIEKYDLPKKEVIEVCQIGKFVYKIDSELQIIDKSKPPNPDFLIQHQSKLIGLEHTRMFTENAQAYHKIETLIQYAQDVYSLKYDNNVLAEISILNDELDYKQNEKKQLATEIADFVYNYKYNLKATKPDFISEIRTTSHTQISFSYREKNSSSPYLTLDKLKSEVNKKERKIDNYKQSDSSISEFWLVLLIGSLSSATYQLDESTDYRMESLFDRVYLMTDFEAEIVRVK